MLRSALLALALLLVSSCSGGGEAGPIQGDHPITGHQSFSIFPYGINDTWTVAQDAEWLNGSPGTESLPYLASGMEVIIQDDQLANFGKTDIRPASFNRDGIEWFWGQEADWYVNQVGPAGLLTFDSGFRVPNGPSRRFSARVVVYEYQRAMAWFFSEWQTSPSAERVWWLYRVPLYLKF